MRSHPADTLVSLGGQRVARAAADKASKPRPGKWPSGHPLSEGGWQGGPTPPEYGQWGDRAKVEMPPAEAKAWRAHEDALADYGPRHPAKPKPLSDRMNVGE